MDWKSVLIAALKIKPLLPSLCNHRSLKNFQSAVIHLNLIAALGLADLIFLIGADDTEDEVISDATGLPW